MSASSSKTTPPLTYSVLLEPAEEGGYVVTVPALPGVVTQGDTYEQALAMAADAIRCYLESLVEDGEPVPVETEASRPLLSQVVVDSPAAA